MYRSLKERGRVASDYYAGSREYFYLSPAGLTLLNALKPLMHEHCRGKVLDAGAGRCAYRDLLLESADEYVGMDIDQSSAVAVVGDAQHLPFADESFDTVFCSQVLEHIPNPCLSLGEFLRVLRPEGKLILSVPHISWLHNEPHDYYRYTNHGLEFLLRQGGFVIKNISPAGGLLSLLGHIPSTLLVNLTFGVPLVHPLVRCINKFLVCLFSFLDTYTERKKLFALNYVSVAVKREATCG